MGKRFSEILSNVWFLLRTEFRLKINESFSIESFLQLQYTSSFRNRISIHLYFITTFDPLQQSRKRTIRVVMTVDQMMRSKIIPLARIRTMIQIRINFERPISYIVYCLYTVPFLATERKREKLNLSKTSILHSLKNVDCRKKMGTAKIRYNWLKSVSNIQSKRRLKLIINEAIKAILQLTLSPTFDYQLIFKLLIIENLVLLSVTKFIKTWG